MSKKKNAAGSGHSTTAKSKSSDPIIAEPIDVVNMSGADSLTKELQHERIIKTIPQGA